MTHTERKLDEAKFFLKQLKPNYPFFDYILSAFLNASRSTTWIMRNEFQSRKGWQDWFDNCQVTDEETSLMKKINQLRIKSAKQSGVYTDYYLIDYLVLDEDYYTTATKMLEEFKPGEEIQITISDELTDDNNDEDVYKFRGRVKMSLDESRPSRESIFHVCSEYITFLEKQVHYCVDTFGMKNEK